MDVHHYQQAKHWPELCLGHALGVLSGELRIDTDESRHLPLALSPSFGILVVTAF